MPKKEELENEVKGKKVGKETKNVSSKNTKASTTKKEVEKKDTKKKTGTATKKTADKKTTSTKSTKKVTKSTEGTAKKSTTKKTSTVAKKETKNEKVANNKKTEKTTQNKQKANNKKQTATKKTTKNTTKKNDSKVVKVNNEKNKKPEKEVVAKKTKKVEKVVEEKKVDELTVIEKIKNFLAKIISMQEESAKETAEKEKDNLKTKKEKKNKNAKPAKPEYLLEYYDLPYRYNETVVKILAQTPKRLFVYWDISDNDKEKYIKTFGDDFFEKTYPVLLLYNEDKKYIKEIPINDFANSWYIDIQDPKNNYSIQLGRKFKGTPEIINMAKFQEEQIILKTDYLPFANSNRLEAPNDHVLLEKLPRFFKFRNVKTNQEYYKDRNSFKDVFGNTYDVKEFYNNEYKEEITEGVFDMANPSSRLSSSTFK